MDINIYVVSLLIILVILFFIVRLYKKEKNNSNLQSKYSDKLQDQLSRLDKHCRRLTKENKRLLDSKKIAEVGVWEIDSTSNIPYWSDEAYRIFWQDKDIFIPKYKYVIQLFHKDDREKINKEFKRSIEARDDFNVVGRIYADSGFIHYIKIKGRHEFDSLGNKVKSIGIVHDVTDKVKLEDVLKQMNKNLDLRVEEELVKNKFQQEELFRQSRMAQLGEMISMIAHQWRQPLGAISSISIDMEMKIEFEKFNLDVKKEQDECKAYFKNSLRDIAGLIENLSTTIDDFRNFYKPNKTKKQLDMNTPVKKAFNIIKSSFISKNVEVTQKYESKMLLNIYDGELIQVILNILQNSLDNFVEKQIKEPRVDIATYDNGEYSILSICDNGGGIEDAEIEKIFDPYYSTKGEKNGTGLGLYMSKLIINEHHNGIIEVKNAQDGICFMIRLRNIGK